MVMTAHTVSSNTITEETEQSEQMTYPSRAENCLLGVFHQTLLAEQMAICTLGHLLEGKLPTAAATLNQLPVLRAQVKNVTCF